MEGLDEEEDVEVEESSEPEGQGSTCLVPQVQKVAGSKRKRQTEKQEDEVLSAVGHFLRNRTEQREEDTMSIFCKNLEMKMRRIKDPNILLDLEHQLEEACYQASLKDRDNQAPPPKPLTPTLTLITPKHMSHFEFGHFILISKFILFIFRYLIGYCKFESPLRLIFISRC